MAEKIEFVLELTRAEVIALLCLNRSSSGSCHHPIKAALRRIDDAFDGVNGARALSKAQFRLFEKLGSPQWDFPPSDE